MIKDLPVNNEIDSNDIATIRGGYFGLEYYSLGIGGIGGIGGIEGIAGESQDDTHKDAIEVL